MDGTSAEAGIVAIGIGTVGCKILSNSLPKLASEIKTIFIHSNEHFLINLGAVEEHSILLSKSNNTQRINTPNDASLALKNSSTKLDKLLADSEIVFVLAGLGGATGSGCAPYVTQQIQELGSLCIGMFSLPFGFEGRGKKGAALSAYSKLRTTVDSLLVIKNDNFLNAEPSATSSHSDLFNQSNLYFSSLIYGLSDLMIRPGLINIDQRDLRPIIKSMGSCTVGFGSSSGKNRAYKATIEAIEAATKSGVDIRNGKGAVLNITAGPDFVIREFKEVNKLVSTLLGEQATVVVGTVIDTEMEKTDFIEVTFVIFGLEETIVDMSAAEDGFFAELVRNIEFEPHQASSGIAILSYFGEVIKTKHSDIESRVRIEQTNNSVCMVIETSNGDVEKIEKTLEEYGQVIVGNKTPSEFLSDELEAQKLSFKLELAQVELRQANKILEFSENQNSEYKERLKTLELQVFNLQDKIAQGLASSNNNLELVLSKQEQIPSNLIALLDSYKGTELSKDTKELIESHINELYLKDRPAFINLTDLVKNGIYGVTGNGLYHFLSTLVNTFPK